LSNTAMQLMKVGMCPWPWPPGARLSKSTDSEAGQERFQSAFFFSALRHGKDAVCCVEELVLSSDGGTAS
jgi:hypothetical protein